MVEFEWDDAKAGINLRKHGVSFEAATAAFDDIYGCEISAESFEDGEVRSNLVAMVGIDMIAVIYVVRDERIRIISARRATKNEEKIYARIRP